MKKSLHIFAVVFTVIIMTAFTISATAVFAAENTPSLKSISFKNASVDGEFSPDVFYYEITLDSSDVSPTLESYETDGEAQLFITYMYNDENAQIGIAATLKYDGGSITYSFNYTNASIKESKQPDTLTDAYTSAPDDKPSGKEISNSAFILIVLCFVAGLIVILLLEKVTAGLLANPYDKNEKPFYRE